VSPPRARWALLTGLIAGAVLAILFLATPAASTHEIDHRYLVVGYVQEGSGQAIPRSRVRLVREKTGLSHETMTERDGFYLLIVHLHDDDAGEALQITAGRAQARIRAWFHPGDAARHRGTRLDFLGAQARERSDLFDETLADQLTR